MRPSKPRSASSSSVDSVEALRSQSSSSTSSILPGAKCSFDLPLDHLVDDDPEGHAVAAAALELGEEADRDLGRHGDRVVLASHLDPAAVEDHAVVALDEGGVLAGFEESCVLGVSRIVHRCSSQLGHGPILRSSEGASCGCNARPRHPRGVEEEQGIYRDEVTTIMWKFADINIAVREILRYLQGDDDEWEEEEEGRSSVTRERARGARGRELSAAHAG